MARFNVPVAVPTGEKWCRCCGAVKPVAEFNVDRYRSDELRTYCRICDCAKAVATKQRKRDLREAGRRMTDPASVTPAEREATTARFIEAMTETVEAREARLGPVVAAKAAKPRKARAVRYPAGCCAMFPTPADAQNWHRVCGNRG